MSRSTTTRRRRASSRPTPRTSATCRSTRSPPTPAGNLVYVSHYALGMRVLSYNNGGLEGGRQVRRGRRLQLLGRRGPQAPERADVHPRVRPRSRPADLHVRRAESLQALSGRGAGHPPAPPSFSPRAARGRRRPRPAPRRALRLLPDRRRVGRPRQVPVLDVRAARAVVERAELVLLGGAGRHQQQRLPRLAIRSSSAGLGGSPESTSIVLNITNPGTIPASSPRSRCQSS